MASHITQTLACNSGANNWLVILKQIISFEHVTVKRLAKPIIVHQHIQQSSVQRHAYLHLLQCAVNHESS